MSSLLNSYPDESGGEQLVYGNRAGVVLMASTSLSAGTAIAVTNFGARGILAFMNITSGFPGSASVTYCLKVKAVSPLSVGATVVLAAATPRSASGQSTVMIYPGIAASAGVNCQVNCALPRDLQIVASASLGATSKEVVLSLGMMFIL